jgi:hypothetical protein
MDLSKKDQKYNCSLIAASIMDCIRTHYFWVKKRLRCYIWKQRGRRGYRELRKLGVSRDHAWNTAKSTHGPWRLSRSPGLAFAPTPEYFAKLELPRLFVKPV